MSSHPFPAGHPPLFPSFGVEKSLFPTLPAHTHTADSDTPPEFPGSRYLLCHLTCFSAASLKEGFEKFKSHFPPKGGKRISFLSIPFTDAHIRCLYPHVPGILQELQRGKEGERIAIPPQKQGEEGILWLPRGGDCM